MTLKNRLLKRQYAVAVAERNQNREITELDYKVIKNGLNYWVADPFPIEKDGTLFIFGEIFQYTKNKGSIGYTKLKNGRFSPWKIVIEEDYHLSFPNIIEENGQIYIYPEANESNSIYRYKCVQFPDRWIKDNVIVSKGTYVDTVFYKRDSVDYGITFDIKDDKGKLRLFKYDDNGCDFGADIEYADTDFSRPAGKIYSDKGQDILPTQIGVPTYGAGLVLNKFQIEWPEMELDPICKLFPKDFKFDINREYVGIHTLNFTEHYVVVDVKWYGFNLINNVFKIIRKVFRNKTSNAKR